ncbi:RNA polymerase sigma factor [Membranicola marinus]|uniref:RNA polymerase sigma factor n=1 Tax=Membranihabitans marinus TaxID=1227546 RepID=A0A953L7X8_9BACT|nr:RNA polymerase sigma factor [Membranihabitans marinus]MBY5957090.1 RNA polymerase sigma factor [Membranihabitans marinus]
MNYHQVFNEDVFPLRDKLYRFSLSIVRKNDIAEDVVQEILIKVWDKREDWEKWRNMNAMIYTMTKNLSLDKLKSKNNQLYTIPEGYDTPADSANPVQRVISMDVECIIHKAIGTLNEIQRMVIQLRDIEGHTYQEIADMTDLTMAQVKVNLHRGRLELRDKLKNKL